MSTRTSSTTHAPILQVASPSISSAPRMVGIEVALKAYAVHEAESVHAQMSGVTSTAARQAEKAAAWRKAIIEAIAEQGAALARLRVDLEATALQRDAYADELRASACEKVDRPARQS